MRLWPRVRQEKGDAEAGLAMELQQYQVEENPPVPLQTRIQNNMTDSSRRTWAGVKRTCNRQLCGAIGASCCGLLAILILETIFFLFVYFDVYQSVFPGSKVAANMNKNTSTYQAYEAFQWMINSAGLILTVPAAFYLLIGGVKLVNQTAGKCVAALIALPWFAVCAFLGTWQFWLPWMLTPVWTDIVWNGACQVPWDMNVDVIGVTWSNLPTSLPYVATALVVLSNNRGNYSLELARDGVNHEMFTLYNLNRGAYPPPLGNITYNSTANTYAIDKTNVTTSYTMKPNLAFPSLDVSLVDPSIAFDNNWGPPAANLVYRNGSTTSPVLKTITDSNNCQKLKLCGMLDQGEGFQIALGVVMMYEFSFVVGCTTPSNNNN
jgi:hypothetical protein